MRRFAFFLQLPVILLAGHAYVALRLIPDLSTTMTMRLIALTAVALMYALIVLGFFVRGSAGKPVSDAASWAGFIMLGMLSWLFVLTIIRDAALIVGMTISLIPGTGIPEFLADALQPTAWLVVSLALAATVAGFFNARRRPAVMKVDITIPGLPTGLDGFTIAQITDLHVGPTIKKGFVEHVVRRTNQLDADLIVLTGDLVDGTVAQLGSHTYALSALRAHYGVYGVTGNHEYYAGADPWVTEFRRLGISMLMNQHVIVRHRDASLVLAGVTDFSAGKFDAQHTSDPLAAIQGSPDSVTTRILLAHQPRSMFRAESAGFDLQLSGHTHGGQFWPWAYFVPVQQPLVSGLHTYKRMQVYVSRGTGYWGPPLRLGAPSEITHIRLRVAPNCAI